MTKEEILAMEGNRLRAEVASQIMGLKVEYPFAEGYPYYLREDKDSKMKWDTVPDYPKDISAAWQVVEKMIKDGYVFCFDWASGKIATVIRCIFEETFTKAESEESIWTDGKTAPEAICKAALLAKLEVVNA